MLFSLLLANITVLLYFSFLFCVVFNNLLTIPVVTENAELIISIAIPTGVPITVANNAINILLLVADRIIKDLSNNQKKQCIY